MGKMRTKIRILFSLAGLLFLILGFLVHITNYGEHEIRNYERCHICLGDNLEEFNCYCKNIIEYSDKLDPLIWSLWSLGVGFMFLMALLAYFDFRRS